MRWPANVLAFYALDAGFGHERAITAVALALAATEGDSDYLWESTSPGGHKLVGPWAIPGTLLADDEYAGAWRLSVAARSVRRLTGPTGDDWSWSAVFTTGDWKKRVRVASEGVADPQPGVVTDIPQRTMAVDSLIAGTRSATEQARASMLGSLEHLRKQV